MLKFKVTQDRKFIKLIEFTLNHEKKSLYKFFKRKSKEDFFNDYY